MTLTAQDIFNTAYLGVINQGGCAVDVDPRPRCQYRAANGRKCAFGHLISDESYTSLMEGKGAYYVIHGYDGFDHLKNHTSLIRDMQYAHDQAARTRSTTTSSAPTPRPSTSSAS